MNTDLTALVQQGYLINPHAVAMALAALALWGLGLATLWHDRRSRTGQLFLGFALALGAYFACFALAYNSPEAEKALFWVRLAYLAVPVVPVLLYHFVGSLEPQPQRNHVLLALGWALAGFFILAVLSGDWLIAGVDQHWWGYYKRYGPLGLPFLAYALAYGALTGSLYRRLLKASPPGSRGRVRLRLHVRALCVGGLIGVDFLAGLGWPVYPGGYLAALALVAMLFFALQRYGPVFFTPVLSADTVLETMGEALFVVDEDGVVRLANHAAEELLARRRQAILGQPLGRLLPVELLQGDLLGLFAQSPARAHEVSYGDQGGDRRFLSLSGRTLRNRRGEPLAALCVARDVSEQRQAQEALRLAHDQLEQKVEERTSDLRDANQRLWRENQERRRTGALLRQSEEKYRLLVDNAMEAIFICQDGLIRFCNIHTREIFGYSQEQLAGKPFLELLHPQDRGQWPHLALTTPGQERQWRALTQDGRVLAVQILGVQITWEGGPASLYFLRDVTLQKELEAQLEHAGKLQAVGTLASGIAHDFSNLLQAISGYSHLLRLSCPPGSEQTRNLDEIALAVERGSQLVKSLLNFGRKLPQSNQAVDINQVAAHAADLLARTIPKMIAIKLELEPGLPLIQGDLGQLEQVLLNLGVNAKDAMPGGGTIAMTTGRATVAPGDPLVYQGLEPGAYLTLTMRDDGQGMDESTRSRAFEPFFTTKEMGQGSGLGLFMAYGVAQRHGGLISCQSRPGGGTTFALYLPVPPGELAFAPASPPPQPQARGSEAILLVDDERAVLEPASQFLGQAGYRVYAANSGEGALELLRGGQEPDLVVLDLGMPGMGGLECLRRLRSALPGLKVIVASGYDLQETRQQVSDLGAWGFLAKPYGLHQLLVTVRQALDA
jgi:PAS domain S-box-containing protein